MSALCSHPDFLTLLAFAVGVADRGIPLSVVSLGVDPDGPLSDADGPRLEARMAELTRRTDRVASTRPGLYACLLLDCNRQGALVFADRLVEGLSEWADGAGLTVRCGIACFGDDLEEPDVLMRAAEAARRRAGPERHFVAIHGE